MPGRGSVSTDFTTADLIVDGGRKREGEVPPLLARTDFPEDWSILIVQPPGVGGLHGFDESEAFAKLPPISRGAVDALCRLVLLEILPAVIERDLEAFGAALGELQERVGAAFAPAQGGIYATPQAAADRERAEGSGISSAPARARGARLSTPSARCPEPKSTAWPSDCERDSASLARRSSVPRRPTRGPSSRSTVNTSRTDCIRAGDRPSGGRHQFVEQ